MPIHAGNFADVLKHAVLSRLIEYLKRKDKAFRVIDTHAGIGLYDLRPRRRREPANGGTESAGFSSKARRRRRGLAGPLSGAVRAANPDGDLMPLSRVRRRSRGI